MRSTPIKHPPTNTLDLITGRTGWSAIPALLELESRRIIDFDRESGRLYPVTRGRLLAAIRAGHEARDALTHAAQIVGVIQAYVDYDELSEADESGAAWMACGIGELGGAVDDALSGMVIALAHGDHLPDEQEGDDDR